MSNAAVEIIYTILKNCEQYENQENCSECAVKDTAECKGCKWLYIPGGNGGHTLWGVEYLLGQIVRQVDVPTENKHISEKAKEKWCALGLDIDDIWKYKYQDTVKYTVSEKIEIEEFKGASKTPLLRECLGNGEFKFRDVFHDEHIVPIHDILKKMIEEKDRITHEQISNYLNSIHVCRILKSEDRIILPKYNRGYDLDYKKIYENIYKNNGVIIAEFE